MPLRSQIAHHTNVIFSNKPHIDDIVQIDRVANKGSQNRSIS
jgi:hypothetical protein